MSLGRPRAADNMHFFVPFKIGVVNKQLFSPLSWNNPLGALGASYMLMINRHLDAKKKHPLVVEGVYNM